MRGLTLYQPWASLWANGSKPDETRSWSTPYRGPVLVHAGLAKQYLADACLEPFRTLLHLPTEGCIAAALHRLPRGQALAVGELVACVRTEDVTDVTDTQRLLGDYSGNRYAWRLAHVMPIEPFAMKGAQGLWRVPEPIAGRLLAMYRGWRRGLYESNALVSTLASTAAGIPA